MQRKLCGFNSVNFDITVRLLIIYPAFIHQLLIDFKKAYDSVRRGFLCNILIEFDIPIIVVRLIKVCLNETYSRVWVGKHLYDMFPITILPLVETRCFIIIAFQHCFRMCHREGSGKPEWFEIK